LLPVAASGRQWPPVAATPQAMKAMKATAMKAMK
jgi:hypothetical protein